MLGIGFAIFVISFYFILYIYRNNQIQSLKWTYIVNIVPALVTITKNISQ